MSVWEAQLLQSVDGMSEVYRQPLLEMIKLFRKSIEMESGSGVHGESASADRRKLGIAKGKTLVAEDYDFDACNHEIAEMFGVNK